MGVVVAADVVLCLVVDCVVVVSVVLSVVVVGGCVSWEDDEDRGVVVGAVVDRIVVLLRVVFVASDVGGRVVRTVVGRGLVEVVFGSSESTTPTGPSMLTSASGQVSSSGWIE